MTSKYLTTRVSIDSSHRDTESVNVLESTVYELEKETISIQRISENISNLVFIIPGHDFKVNDSITVQGVQTPSFTLNDSMTFVANSSFIRINHPNHGLNFDTINDMYISITGCIGNKNSGTYYNNIPINAINTTHKIVPVTKTDQIKNGNHYYINIHPITSCFSATYKSSLVSIMFKTFNGIDPGIINAGYPLSETTKIGFHTVTKVDSDTVYCRLMHKNNINISNVSSEPFTATKIIQTISGYPNNNSYKISLRQTFGNVKSIRMVSTIFPNSEQTINSSNNKFIWKTLANGSTEYSITLENGVYNDYTLCKYIDESISKVKKSGSVLSTENKCFKSSSSIDPVTGTFSIEFFDELYIPNSLLYTSTTDDNGSNKYVFMVKHSNHHLVVGMNVTISGSTSTNGVPSTVIDGIHEIIKIIDENSYLIDIPKHTSEETSVNVNGGPNTKVMYPIKVQLCFDRQGTFGSVLGFKSVGEIFAKTQFLFKVTSKDRYLDDFSTSTTISTSTSKNMYINMILDTKSKSLSTGTTQNVFCKLFLNGRPGSVLYNEFVQIATDANLQSLSELYVSFRTSSGELYDFNGHEHSYVLDIIEELNE